MHPHFADGALPLQVGVGLTQMAVTPRRQRLFCSGTLCGRGYGGWFCPSTGQRSGRYVYPVGIAPVLTRSGPQVRERRFFHPAASEGDQVACAHTTRAPITIPGYPGLSQFIWQYPSLTPDFKSCPVFRWTVELRRGVTRPAAAARQPGAEMNETYGISTCEGISQDNSVSNFYPDLSRVMQVWLLYPNLNLSRDMQV